MISALLAVVITLLLVVGLHEAGHGLVARLFSVKIKRIAIGFGKPLFSRTSQSGCEWVWGRWPIGGYVHLLNSRIQPVSKTEWPYCFDKKPIWVRCLILVSGGVANILVAFLALTLFYLLGFQQYRPVIKTVAPNSLAANAGFSAHDEIIEFNHVSIASWQVASQQLIGGLGKNKVMVVVFDKKMDHQRELYIDLQHVPVSLKSIWKGVGITPDVHHIQIIPGVPFEAACLHAIYTMQELLGFFLVMVKQLLLKHVALVYLLGPIGLINVTFNSFIQGLSAFSYFIASFSLAVGLVNLFPIPGLDGGSILYALLEKLRGKPLSIAMETLLHRLAMIIFWVFLVQLILNDIQRFLVPA